MATGKTEPVKPASASHLENLAEDKLEAGGALALQQREYMRAMSARIVRKVSIFHYC